MQTLNKPKKEKWVSKNFTPKPDWRLPEFKHYCADRIHSAMNAWAKSCSQPRLVLITKFKDGSELTEFFDPATVEVGYKHQNEWYYQKVDVVDKWLTRTKEEVTLKQLLKKEADFCKEIGVEVDSFHHFREGM